VVGGSLESWLGRGVKSEDDEGEVVSLGSSGAQGAVDMSAREGLERHGRKLRRAATPAPTLLTSAEKLTSMVGVGETMVLLARALVRAPALEKIGSTLAPSTAKMRKKS
jgi:hypothetical protein